MVGDVMSGAILPEVLKGHLKYSFSVVFDVDAACCVA